MAHAELNNCLRWLFSESKYLTSYLEVGVCEGDSLSAVLESAPALERLALCDTWGIEYGGSGRYGHDHIQAILDRCGYSGEVLWLDGRSQELLPLLDVEFSVVLIDGDHSMEGARMDLENGWRLVKPGGFLIFHDLIYDVHPYLLQLWRDWSCGEGLELWNGCGVGVRWKPWNIHSEK